MHAHEMYTPWHSGVMSCEECKLTGCCGRICSLSWRDGTGQSFVLNSDIKHLCTCYVLGLTLSVRVTLSVPL